METMQTTQAKRLADKLSVLRIDLTASDRAEAKQKFNVTPETISRYLNGKVNDNDFAVSLIKFFESRIEQREKVIA